MRVILTIVFGALWAKDGLDGIKGIWKRLPRDRPLPSSFKTIEEHLTIARSKGLEEEYFNALFSFSNIDSLDLAIASRYALLVIQNELKQEE